MALKKTARLIRNLPFARARGKNNAALPLECRKMDLHPVITGFLLAIIFARLPDRGLRLLTDPHHWSLDRRGREPGERGEKMVWEPDRFNARVAHRLRVRPRFELIKARDLESLATA